MKNLIRCFVFFTGYIFSFFLNPIIIKKIKNIYILFYSGYKKRQFKYVGNNFILDYPIYLQNSKNVVIGNNFSCGKRMRLDTISYYMGYDYNPIIEIGNGVNIQNDCHIGAINKIIIGDDVLIASKVLIMDHAHGKSILEDVNIKPLKRKLYSKGGIFIGNKVWIGENVVILANVVIGNNCIIGANSVVTKSFGKNLVIAGNPAEIIKKLDN